MWMPIFVIPIVLVLYNIFFGESVSPTMPILGWVIPVSGDPTIVNLILGLGDP